MELNSYKTVHANAKIFEDTDWKLILTFYNTLFERTKNPIVAMNRCLALAEVEGAEKGIEELLKLDSLADNSRYHLSLGELYFKIGEMEVAKKYFNKALSLTISRAEQELIDRKIKLCDLAA